MVTGAGSAHDRLTESAVQSLLAEALEPLPLERKRVLVILPDGTRHAPIPLLCRLLQDRLGRRVERLDYLIALGTHAPMNAEALEDHLGANAQALTERFPNVRLFQHQWNQPASLTTIGIIPRQETAELTGGLLAEDIPVRVNRMVLEYDEVVLVGPVYPHEFAGFSGGAKSLFPGVSGHEIIDAVHWAGALVTNRVSAGDRDTPARRLIHRAADFLPRPPICLSLVLQGEALHGLYIGPHLDAFNAAADLSARLNIRTFPTPFGRLLTAPSRIYGDLWTAAKAMYRTEAIVADGGELILYAPHITEVSFTHGETVLRLGYHVRDFFLKQWDRFSDIPRLVLGHSTLLRGAGTYQDGIERPRIQVTLATGIAETVCRQLNLGYREPGSINPATWQRQEGPGSLFVPESGETLFRLENPMEAIGGRSR
jgi:nickel-dependent lactate racemase